jgi:polyhydroxyalkanoate synthesis regulator phasin
MKRKKVCPLALAGLVAFTAGSAFAQDNQALIDALVRKGILSQKEAEKIQQEVSKNPAVSEQAQSPIKLAPWIKELKFSGDLRLRYQYDTAQLQEPIAPNSSGTNGVQQRSRWRFRLRLFVDMIFDNGFFGGFGLGTSAANDTGNQTYVNDYRNYSIFIYKAFLGWKNDWLTFVAGKQDFPFYETDLFYDPSLYPSGLVERVDFHKLFGWGSGGEPVADGKEAPPPPPAPKSQNAFELSLIAGQFIMDDNNEFNAGGAGLNWDAYQFQEQLLFRYKTPSWSVTLGPELFTPNKAAVGHQNTPFSVDGFQFHTRPLFLPNIGGEEADLFIIRGPGDITLNLIPKIPIKIYWDLAYNFDGGKRFNLLGTAGQSNSLASSNGLQPDGAGPTGIFSFIEHVPNGKPVPPGTVFPTHTGDATGIAFPASARVGNTFDDDFAWLVGIKIGDNKKACDWSIYADYRQVGVASVDPEVGPSDPMNGRLNFQGFGMGVLYNVTDYFLLSVSGRIDWNLKNLYGGQLTRGSGIADYNSWNYVRVDAIMKF